MADPDLQISGWGEGGSQKISLALWASVWLQNKGTPRTPGPSPGSASASYSWSNFTCGLVYFSHPLDWEGNSDKNSRCVK